MCIIPFANQSQTRDNKTRLRQREERETIRKAASLKHPLVHLQREVGAVETSSRARQEQQARIQASQLHRGELHRFEPWPNSYSIRHVLRNPRSGTLIASEFHWLLLSRGVANMHDKVRLVDMNRLYRTLVELSLSDVNDY